MLKKIIDIQNVGRFNKLHVPRGIEFSETTLVFGENGWGKSTIADVLRSYRWDRPEIIVGRKTLAETGEQKVILLFSGSKQAEFTSGKWSSTPPPIAIFDQTFINENVCSGDNISHEHLANQHGLIVGERGVAIFQQIQETELEETRINAKLNEKTAKINRITSGLGLSTMAAEEFVGLSPLPDAPDRIKEKNTELLRATKKQQIQNASLPETLPVPPCSEELNTILGRSIEGVVAMARERVREHIESHVKPGEEIPISHETWLEAGLAFSMDQNCPFCGQELQDRDLVDIYGSYFSDAFKKLSEDVRKHRQILADYITGRFRNVLTSKIEANSSKVERLASLTDEEFNSEIEHEAIIKQIEEAANKIDVAFIAKQEDLGSNPVLAPFTDAFEAWDLAREKIEAINLKIESYQKRIKEIRREQEDTDVASIKHDLATLEARVKRFEEETAKLADAHADLSKEMARLQKKKKKLRKDLKEYCANISERLGSSINAFLRMIRAGFSIKYQEPHFRGKNPAAAYAIEINNTTIPAKETDPGKPGFRNTLSTGDKAALAFAFFLATLDDDNLSETIIVLDDPFNSQDGFRRRFTANEIKKLSSKAAQVIVLSHEKAFLHLVWDRMPKENMTCLTMQSGTPKGARLGNLDIVEAMKPRGETERSRVIKFLEDGVGEPAVIRPLLRKVLEKFYRNADKEFFDADHTLGIIISKIKGDPGKNPFKGALEELEDINDYTNTVSHDEVPGDPAEQSTEEELRSYCERVIDLTRGAT